MAKITKPSWLGDSTYAKKATYPDDDLEHLIMSTLSKVNVLYDEIIANNQKVGISSSQASAITANTAKTGITTAQSRLITALNEGVQQAVPTNDKAVTAIIEPIVVIGKKASALELRISLSNKQIYTTSLTLTRIK